MTIPLEPGSGRPRVLLAPVTVSPTKPLTPFHLKLLLSVDMLHRATATFADVTHVYHPLAHAGSRQVVGFWEYLDRLYPQLDATECGEAEIGELYGQFQRAERVGYPVLEPLVRRAAAGWAHPVSLRLQQLWEAHFELLGMIEPSLGRTGPALMAADELIDLLVRHHLAIDGRPFGAPVYLDASSAGLPLRVMVGPDGQANYLLSILAELVAQLPGHDSVVLAHDVEVRADYRTIAHVLTRLGARVWRLEFPRVPLDGRTHSTRFGGWQRYTVDALAGPLVGEFGRASVALGLRLYLVAGLGRTAPDSFSVRHLRRWTQRAGRLLAEHAGRPEAPGDLSPLAGRLPYVDPYRLVTAFLSRDPLLPPGRLLGAVLGPVPATRAGSAA